MLLDRYSLAPYHYAMPKVGYLPPVKCPPSPVLSETPPPGYVAPLVKADIKLVNTAYPYLAAGYRNGDHCEIRICG